MAGKAAYNGETVMQKILVVAAALFLAASSVASAQQASRIRGQIERSRAAR